jgi:hypothetical protein
VFDSFIGKLQAAHESAASQELDEDIAGAEREKVKKSMAKKKMSAVLKAVRVVSSTQSASIEWAPDYVRSEQEEQYWMETSDTHTHSQRREVMSSADVCLSMSVCVCSTQEHAGALRLIAAITAVYDAQGTDKLKSAAAAAGDDDEKADSADEQSEISGQAKKRQRRGSGGSSATQYAADSFERAMSKLAPTIFTAERWLSECGITPEQRVLILAEMPGANPEPTSSLLQAFDDDDFAKIKLSPKQIKAWKNIAAQYKPTA